MYSNRLQQMWVRNLSGAEATAWGRCLPGALDGIFDGPHCSQSTRGASTAVHAVSKVTVSLEAARLGQAKLLCCPDEAKASDGQQVMHQ